MVIATVALHEFIQRSLTGMAEGRMTQIMGQTDRFNQVFIAGQGAGQRAANLGHLDGVGERLR